MRDCEFIEVTQSYDSEDNGIYVRTDDRASIPTKNSTWKHPNGNRAIFYAATSYDYGELLGYDYGEGSGYDYGEGSGFDYGEGSGYEYVEEWQLGTKGHQNTSKFIFKGIYYIFKYLFFSFFCINIE